MKPRSGQAAAALLPAGGVDWRIDSPRLVLRELNLQDSGFILELLNEAAFRHFIGDKGVRDLDGARSYIIQGPMASYARFGYGLYAVTLGEAHAADGIPRGTPIGICGLVKRDTLPDADLGFAFLTRFHGRGYAVEAARAVLEHAKSVLQLERIVAITAVDNYNSMALLEKVGLRFERMIHLAPGGPALRLFVP